MQSTLEFYNPIAGCSKVSKLNCWCHFALWSLQIRNFKKLLTAKKFEAPKILKALRRSILSCTFLEVLVLGSCLLVLAFSSHSKVFWFQSSRASKFSLWIQNFEDFQGLKDVEVAASFQIRKVLVNFLDNLMPFVEWHSECFICRKFRLWISDIEVVCSVFGISRWRQLLEPVVGGTTTSPWVVPE